MKTMKSLALTGAIALVGTIGFTACSASSDDLAAPNQNIPGGSGVNEVTTKFVFNVATSNSPATSGSASSPIVRMSGGNTQANVTGANDFRGITNAELMAFKLMSGSALADGKTVSSAIKANKAYSFGTIIGAYKLDPTNGDASTDVPKSHRVIELSLPTETNTLMLYGKAIKTGSDIEQGKITWKPDSILSNASFSLCRIVPDTPEPATPNIYWAALLQYENLIANVLTEIVSSGIKAGTVCEFGTQSMTLASDLEWGDYANVSSDLQLSERNTSPLDPSGNTPTCALGEILSKAFVTLNTIYPNELRAGAGEAVHYMMKDLVVVINSVVNAKPVSLQEVVAQEVAKVIKTNIEKYFDVESDYDWKNTATVKANCVSVLSTDKDKVLDTSDLTNFPKFFNLPSGSVILKFLIAKDADNSGYNFKYAYSSSVETYAMGGSTTASDSFDPKNYTYPAELCYFGNSPIRVTNDTKVPNDYPDGVAEWNDNNSWKGWSTGGHVLSTTRSVAMQYSINYGTALLATTVRYGANVLEDNNANIQKQHSGASEANNKIDVTSLDTHFQLTGVLIGGQEPEVGWNYLAKSATPGFGTMVYDNVGTINIPKATSATGGEKSAVNYTLLWDNWQESLKGQKQRDVYIALEFKNNAAGFWGENNFIRNGATFYIVGKLDPDAGHSTTDLSDGITWPSNQALPPYEADGSTVKQRRVFIQDFMTTANFVIGPTSLQHALVAVPDLRAGQISLGLSVDLSWQTGLSFNDIVLGD